MQVHKAKKKKEKKKKKENDIGLGDEETTSDEPRRRSGNIHLSLNKCVR
jgi:hypothetical protein